IRDDLVTGVQTCALPIFLTDLLAFIFTAIAAVVILTTGFIRADAIASLIVAAIMFRAAYGLLRDSGRVLLEAAPEGMSVTEIGEIGRAACRDRVEVWGGG